MATGSGDGTVSFQKHREMSTIQLKAAISTKGPLDRGQKYRWIGKYHWIGQKSQKCSWMNPWPQPAGPKAGQRHGPGLPDALRLRRLRGPGLRRLPGARGARRGGEPMDGAWDLSDPSRAPEGGWGLVGLVWRSCLAALGIFGLEGCIMKHRKQGHGMHS